MWTQTETAPKHTSLDHKEKPTSMKINHLLLLPLLPSLILCSFAAEPIPGTTPLPPPPQDQGLPYTRSAEPVALDKIKGGIAVFAGSRYAYINGLRVRLDDADLLRVEAVEKDGVIYVPAAFAAVVSLQEITPPPVPADLASIADRWVYAPHELTSKKLMLGASANVATLQVKEKTYYSIADVAKARGLTITQNSRGLFYAGVQKLEFDPGQSALLDSVIALFDTPDKLADPDIATKYIPDLTRQGKWTDHVKVTPKQLAILNGPETDWHTAPKSEYNYDGLKQKLLGSKVPAPGVYPRLLFTADDVPMLTARLKSTTVGQMSMIEMEKLFKKTWWDPKTSDGQIFNKLASGQLDGLEWDLADGAPAIMAGQTFKGQKPEIYNSHVAYVPECLTSMALYCLLTNDDEHGRQCAAAVANYYKLREPLIDQWLQISDSEFGTSLRMPDGSLFAMNGLGAKTHWRNIHGLVAQMNLGLSLDFTGKWMTAEQKDLMRRVIAKATYGRRSYAQDAPVRFRDVNWMAWDLPHFLAVAAIEGLPGFDAEAYVSGAESVRAFCDWGIDDSGVVFESTGKNPGAFQFQLLSMITLARRGDNLFGHPHWRKLLEGSIYMQSPTGRVMVNSGTQYSPYSRQKLSPFLVTELKAFYPSSRLADYWLSTLYHDAGTDPDELTRFVPPSSFSVADYTKKVEDKKRLRLPGLTYPGMARNVLYDADVQPTTLADLDLPLDFSAPYQGVFSTYSDRTPDGTWMHLYVRPHHYLGAGHHHADAGMFHFSALGVDWFTQSPFSQVFDGDYFNLVQVDGKSEPTAIPGGPLGYNGAATYLGATIGEKASIGSADLTYAYSWRWMTQVPQVWSESLKAMNWELDPNPANLENWAGTTRYKLRPWWTNYTYINYMPTCRAKYNPMKYVFRSTGLVRGDHPYGLVLDDLKKDDTSHLYQWVTMLNGGVWKANLAGLAHNQIALAWHPGDPDLFSNVPKPAIDPKKGDPLLIVCVLGMEESNDPTLPLFQVATVQGSTDKKGTIQYMDRLAINQRAVVAGFKVLLLPIRAGEPIPQVSFGTDSQTARIDWQGQNDVLSFKQNPDHRSHVEIRRDQEIILK
jgi:hypothetical protein